MASSTAAMVTSHGETIPVDGKSNASTTASLKLGSKAIASSRLISRLGTPLSCA